MEQARIGRFIQQLRKERNLTQRELAEKLGVTDRAISKWENGRGIPDVSLMKALCDTLGITVNELLSGERIDQNDYRIKSDSNILTTLDQSDRRIKRKNALLWTVTILTMLLVITGILLIYTVPVTRGYFGADEEIGIAFVHKTLPICQDGSLPERYDYRDFVVQDITERVDMAHLTELLPLLRVSVGMEQANAHWPGDVTYEIFGHISSGQRAGEPFHIYLGDWNYLVYQENGRGHQIVNAETWIKLLGWLEGWEKDSREILPSEEPRTFSIYCQDTLYTGQGQFLELPQNAIQLGTVKKITTTPDEEGECSFGLAGNWIYSWKQGAQTYLAVQLDEQKAYGIPIEGE